MSDALLSFALCLPFAAALTLWRSVSPLFG